jgi:branched-chain amino acid transport system substrate-binding protein
MNSIANTRIGRAVILGALVAGVTAGSAVAAETKGPVTDPIGVVAVRKGDPIAIGGYWVLSGPETALGVDQKRGVEVAFADIGNTVAGHPIRLIAEDSQCNAEGGQTAATKLAANASIVVVLGPACSSAATPGAPILWQSGIPSIATSATAPHLTAPDRGPQYEGFLRTIYSDIWQGKGNADWMYDVLGCRTAATIHDGSPYAEQLVKVMQRFFTEKGGTVTASEAISPQDVDMRPVLTRIATDKPCVVYFPVFLAAAAQIVRQSDQVSGLEAARLVGGGALMTKDFIAAAGDAVVGIPITYSDISTEALGTNYPKLIARYKEMFGEAPIQGFHAHAYDAARIAAMAIEKVAVTDDKGTTYIGRRALLDALKATKGYDGMAGPVECDENGECQKFKFAVYEFNNADPDTFEPGVNPAKVYSAQQ